MNSFKTRSSARKSVLTIVYTFIPLFLLAFLGLTITVAAWIFFEVILLFAFAFCLFLVSKTHWEIEFQGNTVYLYNTGNRQQYCIENLTQSALLIKQTQKQKAHNTADLFIADTPLRMYDVQNCTELLTFIRENIPQ